MVILQSLALAALIVIPGSRYIRSHAGLLYAISALVSVAVIAAVWSGATAGLPAWSGYVVPIFTQGALAGALFMAVMYAAAVPNGSRFMRAVMPVRGELSIIACILTLGHNIAFGRTYFVSLFSGSALPANIMAAAICSLAMLAIMLPLFITSFKRVRRRMQPRRWKRLQRLAYGFYGLMYAHVLLLNLPGAWSGGLGARINVAVYSAIFISYACLRARKALLKHPRGLALVQPLPALGAALMICLCASAWLPANAHSTSAAAAYADGKYSGAAIGHNGRLTVSVVVEEGLIADVRLTGHVEDEPYITNAFNAVVPAVIDSQSPYVDAYTGATYSSNGLMDAISAALESDVQES